MEPSLVELLGAAGLQPATAAGEAPIDLLLYDTPDAVLNLWRQCGQPAPDTQALVEGYRRFVQLRDGSRLISTWRLRQLKADELLAWLHGQADCPSLDTPPPTIDALSAVVTRRLLELQSDALDAYLDLELQAELAGTSPDSNYILRLDSSASGDTLLDRWWQVVQQAAQGNHLAGEVNRLNGEKEVLAQENGAALLEANALKQKLDSQAQKLMEAQEVNQRTLMQLDQAQEELESYFLKNREQDDQLQKLETQLTELRLEQAAISNARDTALETSSDLRQQHATQLEKLHQSQTLADQLASQLQVLEADAACWKTKAEEADQQYAASHQQVIDLRQQLDTQAQKLKEAQEVNQRTLLQLDQAQEELESYLLKNREQDDQLQKLETQLTELRLEQAAISNARDAALETSSDLRQQLEAQLQAENQALQSATANMSKLTNQLQERNQELMTADKNLNEAQEEAERTLGQLHQVQEELEHYFLRANAGDELCQALAQENSRAMGLLGRMLRLQAGL